MPNRFVSTPARGRVAVLIPGLGAVATTFIAGVALSRLGLGRPIGSLTQLGTARIGRRTDGRTVPIKELVPLASMEDLVFGAWDIVSENAWQVALRSDVLPREQLDPIRDQLEKIQPRRGIYDPEFVRRIAVDHAMPEQGHRARIARVRQDIREFIAELGADRAVMITCASTETWRPAPDCLRDLASLEQALDANHPDISPALLYAYAAIREGVPYANSTPNAAADTPALLQLAREQGVPTAGKDLKTGQTMMKTVLAPMLKARMLGLNGWFSTNILGNRDGEVLDDPQAFKAKEVTKTSVLDTILQPGEYPDLYSKFSHKVSIHYYPPRGDQKEGWDNIDLFGWMGMPMQIKVNFLCRDSILAAPLVLDLVLFLDLAKRAEWRGVQEWLSFYFKLPTTPVGLYPEHDLFIQLTKLKNTLRVLAGEEPITHLGLDYYGDDLPLPEALEAAEER
ncbi:MAG: inositol-3-phosphate synthase [Myxococcota bacterium]